MRGERRGEMENDKHHRRRIHFDGVVSQNEFYSSLHSCIALKNPAEESDPQEAGNPYAPPPAIPWLVLEHTLRAGLRNILRSGWKGGQQQRI